MVLVHGRGLDLRMWDEQVPALAARAPVLAYDLRGLGHSFGDGITGYTHPVDLWRLVDALGLDRVVLVGLSMGGRVALEAALLAPGRVAALVLLDAVLTGVPWDPTTERDNAAVQEALLTGGVPAARHAWLNHGFFSPARRRPELAARLAEMVRDCPARVWTGSDPQGPRLDVMALLPTMSVPTTVVVGTLDVPCFRQMADVLAERIPGARKVVVDGAGHMVNMERPAVVNEILLDVLAEAGGAPPVRG